MLVALWACTTGDARRLEAAVQLTRVAVRSASTATGRHLLRLRGSPKLPRGGHLTEPLQFDHHVFTCQVLLGDGHTFSALVDTGSGNLVVPGEACNTPACKRHQRFRPEEDDDGHFIRAASSEISLSYSTGHLTGNGFESRVCLDKEICGQAGFVVAAYESDDFKPFQFDGILGLGPPHQAAQEDFNIVGALARQGALGAPVFSLVIRASGISTLSFGGGEDPGDAEAWLPADSRHGEWAIPLADIVVDSTMQRLCPSSAGCRAILDSGCAGIAVPKEAAAKLTKALAASDCSSVSDLPTLGFAIGNRTYNVAPEQYVEVSESDPSRCRLRVQAIDDGEATRTVILGLPFLTGKRVTFDQGAMRIHIAELPSSGGP